MKILHSLVGYLAVSTLPFYPFAFAYPFAAGINYDGYVNITQIHLDGALTKYDLGSIVETCQAITMQNHSDSALMKRGPGDTIEARQIPVDPVPVVIGGIFVIILVVSVSIAWISHDNPKREAFTKGAMSTITSKYPKYNWVICHSPYSVGFDGVEGKDWGYTHHELGISFGRTIGYDLYWARSGTFYRHGDGGFINWAYNGNIHGTDDHGATIHFATRS